MCGKVTVVPMKRDVDPRLLARLARMLRSGDYAVVNSHLVHADWYAALASLAAPDVALVSTKHNDDPFRRGLPFRLVEKATDGSLRGRDHDLGFAPRLHAALDQAALAGRAGALRPRGFAECHAQPVGGGHADAADRRTTGSSEGPGRPGAGDAARARVGAGGELLIAGEGPERPSLEALVRSLELDDAVRLLGHRSDVAELMRTAWILVHPARWEGFGLVFLEAMRERTSDRRHEGGRRSGDRRRRCHRDDRAADQPGALADAIAAMLADPRSGEAPARGLRRLLEHFSADRMARETAAVYERAVVAAASSWRSISP